MRRAMLALHITGIFYQNSYVILGYITQNSTLLTYGMEHFYRRKMYVLMLTSINASSLGDIFGQYVELLEFKKGENNQQKFYGLYQTKSIRSSLYLFVFSIEYQILTVFRLGNIHSRKEKVFISFVQG